MLSKNKAANARMWVYASDFARSENSAAQRSAVIRTTTETHRVQFPNRNSEMLCWVNERSSNTADVPLPSGDWVLIPIQIDAG